MLGKYLSKKYLKFRSKIVFRSFGSLIMIFFPFFFGCARIRTKISSFLRETTSACRQLRSFPSVEQDGAAFTCQPLSLSSKSGKTFLPPVEAQILFRHI